MLYSAFRHLPQLRRVLPDETESGAKTPNRDRPLWNQGKGTRTEETLPIPPIKWWQKSIEAAWRQGQLGTDCSRLRPR